MLISLTSVVATLTLATVTAPTLAQPLEPDAFLTDWLMIGPFPNGSSSDRARDFASARETDYLGLGEGGESPAPADGRAHVWQGKTYTWRSVVSPTDVVDLTDAYGTLEDVTVYAWTEIEAVAETHAVQALGSDDGVQVSLSGDLLTNLNVDADRLARQMTEVYFHDEMDAQGRQ
ncbi:MAG: hypothetical protein ABGY41_18885 [Candidatus Poribacteria bacterium]